VVPWFQLSRQFKFIAWFFANLQTFGIKRLLMRYRGGVRCFGWPWKDAAFHQTTCVTQPYGLNDGFSNPSKYQQTPFTTVVLGEHTKHPGCWRLALHRVVLRFCLLLPNMHLLIYRKRVLISMTSFIPPLKDHLLS
jgi:hypothetical protein